MARVIKEKTKIPRCFKIRVTGINGATVLRGSMEERAAIAIAMMWMDSDDFRRAVFGVADGSRLIVERAHAQRRSKK